MVSYTTGHFVALFSASDCHISKLNILECMENFESYDSDFHPDFMSDTIILQVLKYHEIDLMVLQKSLESSELARERILNVKKIYLLDFDLREAIVPSGLYFLYNAHVREALKFHEDTLQAFHTTVVS
jgi:hypothetical protein